MMRSIALAAAALLLLSGCSVLRNVHAEADRHDRLDAADEEFIPSGPDHLVDLLGEPDEWRNEKDGDQLLMTAVWNCVDGEYRSVTWQSRIGESGRQYWAVVDDDSRECADGR